MEMKKAGKVHYLESSNFAATGVVVHGFTTRHEGVSRHPYNSLNLGANIFDSPHNVQGNRSILARAFGARTEHLVTVTQVHGNDLLVIDSPNPDYTHFLKLECDGLITNQPGLMIGVCVADCIPILLLDPVNKVVATLHAGWKGTAGEIGRKGVEALINMFDSNPEDILAALGPGIGSCCYEVDGIVREAFKKNGADWDLFAKEKAPGKWKLDLAAANCSQLLAAGVPKANIETTPLCVSCEHDLFFSYRREEGETGRQMGFVMLLD
jgi:YfiH family protein